jgi:hypothetical protein
MDSKENDEKNFLGEHKQGKARMSILMLHKIDSNQEKIIRVAKRSILK